jgi:hypothetical protein
VAGRENGATIARGGILVERDLGAILKEKGARSCGNDEAFGGGRKLDNRRGKVVLDSER